MAKRGRKKNKIVCSWDLEEYEFEDLILITKVKGPVLYNTYVHKKYKDNLPDGWVLHNKYSK